eukprot:scaffold5281_cov127-Cylindrotheca_fusiformis.AAC.17
MRMDEDEDDTTAKAYASITARLDQFTSSAFGGSLQHVPENESTIYQMDAMDWLSQELKDDDDAPMTPTNTLVSKRTSILERAETPVMSNSSQKKKKKKKSRSNDDDSDEDMEPIQTPYKPAIAPLSPLKYSLQTRQISSTYHVYRRYHDALYALVKAKRSLDHRIDLEQQDLALVTNTTTTQAPSSSLAMQETRAEVDFLQSLSSVGYSTGNYPEGDAWKLLAQLRQLGLSALIWDNDSISASQNMSAQIFYLEQLASKVEKTPLELRNELVSSSSTPLVLKRKYHLLKWMEQCLAQHTVPPPRSSSMSEDISSIPPDLQIETLGAASPQIKELLRSCLSYILAGKLDEALEIVRKEGQPWRAASWSGGQPHGYEKITNARLQAVQLKTSGNPNRALWKRQMWKAGRKLASFEEEAAIYSLLANDTNACLRNPHFSKSWLNSLYAIWFGIWGRLEDELFHWHNNRRRQKENPYPGTQFSDQESEQLLATSGLAGITEAQVIQQLLSSPFPQVRGTGLQSCMAAFLIGKSAILQFCRTEVANTPTLPDTEDQVNRLRFLTHVLLYLDSLQVGITPMTLNGISAQKDQLLFQYVQYLASRPDLWQLLAVYTSLLPEPKILDYYPTVLTQVMDETERKHMLEQIQELMPHLEIQILRRVVQLSISQSNNQDEETKCKSIGWLLQQDGHFGDALICANIVLRGFFLDEHDEKMETATIFVQDYLPEDLLERAGQPRPPMDKMSPDDYNRKVDNARTEHLAFLEYLDAYRTFNNWKDVMSTTPSRSSNHEPLDMTHLNPTEASIAKHRLVKDFVRRKRENCQAVLEAAEQAKSVLKTVLVHPGGWLSVEGDAKDVEERTRHVEISEIRSRYLVLAVEWYHVVCEETAMWMSKSLDESASVGLSRREALEMFGEEALSPSYWYQHALDLAVLVADDSHGILKAFKSLDLQEFLAKLAETAISKLMSA